MHRLHTSRRGTPAAAAAHRAATAAPPVEPLGDLRGIWGRPYIDLEPYVDTSRFDEIHEEICFALTQVPTSYTGGSHKWMGIVPPSLAHEPYVDYGQTIEAMGDADFARFLSLADEPSAFDPARRREYEFGEERPHPLSRRQMRWLELKFGVYFPWKVFYELIPTSGWEDKIRHKPFTEEAEAHFPRLVALVKSLPFAQIGRCNVMGLEANDHGTVHHDRSSDEKVAADHFISFCPRGDKRLYLWDEGARRKVFVAPRVYWFNDGDYHGVEPDPYFRYSVRVDGFFRPELLERLRRDMAF